MTKKVPFKSGHYLEIEKKRRVRISRSRTGKTWIPQFLLGNMLVERGRGKKKTVQKEQEWGAIGWLGFKTKAKAKKVAKTWKETGTYPYHRI